MKKHFPALALACLLLCGCSKEAAPTETAPATTATEVTVATQPASMYDPGNPLEAEYRGDLRVYPLSMRKVTGMCSTNDGLLVFSGYGSTTLTLLTGGELSITATLTLDFELDPEDPSLRIHDSGISYFDPVHRQTVVLDGTLKVISHIAAPENLTGSPILSCDRSTLYYCTGADVRAWDLDSGIHRCIKEMSFDSQSVTGLHANDTVLQCTILDGNTQRTLLFFTDTGRLICEGDGGLILTTFGDRYLASVPTGAIRSLVFGGSDGTASALTPSDITSEAFLLEARNAVVTASGGDSVQLDYYELDTGLRRSVLTLDAFFYPKAVVSTADDAVYLLVYDPETDCDTILRWDISGGSSLIINDGTIYTGPYYTALEADHAGLAQCQAYAAEIGETYGIEVLVWEDVFSAQTRNYNFEAEYLVPVIRQELENLEHHLGNFPEGFLETTASHFTSLKICLVRAITGTAESGSLETAGSVQFLNGTDACIALSVGPSSEKSLYHELYHVMETHILGNSIAFDQWEKLNPKDFAYDYSYQANLLRSGSEYLQDETRSFIDTFSMSFPSEDRARLLEYAMTQGNESYFRSPYMQAKLSQLCVGIREAYGLKKTPETYLWEQYLSQSLAYSK